MIDLNLWQPTENLAADYVAYKLIHEELAALFTESSDRQFHLYDVEHVFWIKGGNPTGGMKPAKAHGIPDGAGTVVTDKPTPNLGDPLLRLPDSYVPPVVSIISSLAINDPALTEAAAASGTSIPRAFEKSIDAAFTIIGYESRLLGQGKGRCPDGISQDIDNSYAIIWDA